MWLDRWNDPWTPPDGVVRITSLTGVARTVLTVGFDLDMTLVDPRPGIRASMDALAQETGVPIDVDVVIARLGPKLEWELAQWFPADQVEHMCERYRCALLGPLRRRRHVAACPARTPAIEAVQARGGRAVIVTAKTERLAHRCIDSVGLAVDAVVGHVHGDEKRDALIEHAAGIYVGTPSPTSGPRSTRRRSPWASRPGPTTRGSSLAAGADVVFESLDEFPGWLATII